MAREDMAYDDDDDDDDDDGDDGGGGGCNNCLWLASATTVSRRNQSINVYFSQQPLGFPKRKRF